MYVGILKLQVEGDEPSSESWQRAAKAMCEKLQARFKVMAKAGEGTSFVVVSLAHQEKSLHDLFDKVMAFCEQSGIGRVHDELLFVDHIDVFGEEDDY